MTYNIKPDNNHYNGTVFKIANNNDFKQKIYLNNISIDTFTKNIDETNNYLMFLRRVSINNNKNPYWLGNGPELEYHLCILHIPTGFYNTIEDLINTINSEYLKAISNLNNTEIGDIYYNNDIQYLIQIENNNLIFNPNLYAIPVCLNNTIYSEDINYEIIKTYNYEPANIVQNVLNLTSNIQNYETTNIYNYLLNYYADINSINGLINYSKNTMNLFNKLGILNYKLDFNNTNIAFINNKPIYLIKGSTYNEFLFIGSLYDVINETTINYENIETNIFNFDIPIETSIISRPFPILDYENDIVSETRYNMQTNVKIMNISSTNLQIDNTKYTSYINWTNTEPILNNINSEKCPYSYFYKTEDITYLDIYDSSHNTVYNTFKQYSTHTFTYNISNVFAVSYYPIEKNNDEYVMQYNISFEGIEPSLQSKKYNMLNGEIGINLPISIENNSIDFTAFYENSYKIETNNNVILFTNTNNDLEIKPFSSQILIKNNNYTNTGIKILDINSNNLITIAIKGSGFIDVITSSYSSNDNIFEDSFKENNKLTFSINLDTIVDITYYDPYLFITSCHKDDNENSVFETYGIFRESTEPEISFILAEDNNFPIFTATVNSFQLNNISPIETILGPNDYRYQLFNYYSASVRQFAQNSIPNLHPSDKLFVYYSFDENIDKILNNTSMKNEQIFSLLTTINLDSILKPYATINSSNIILYENNVNHIQQNIDKTIDLLPYTTIYIYITSNELRYPLQKSDYILSYEIL